MQGLNLAENNIPLTHGFSDDCDGSLAGYTDAGTVAVQDEAGGVVKATTGTTANNEAYRIRTKKTFLLADGKPLLMKVRAKFTDADSNTGAVIIGISSEAGAALIADGGAAVKSGSQTTLAFVKLTGESNWRCYSKIATSEQSDILSATNKNNVLGEAVAPDGEYQELQIEVIPNANDAIVAFSVDKQVVCRHRVDLASAVIAAYAAFVKTTTTTAQSLSVDFQSCHQKR